MRGKKLIARMLSVLLTAALAFSLTACGGGGNGTEESGNPGSADPAQVSSQLTCTGEMALDYAEEFRAFYYEDGYALVTISDGSRYLVVPEGKEAPEDLAEGVTVLQQPLENIYLAASAAMDMFVSIDALDTLGFSALKESGWYIEEARQAMEEERLVYAGKYSAPDYELILSRGCSLAVENTMIFHTPEVKEQLENFGIPVLVDRSSYEKTPQGRMEWVKLYGLLTGKEEAAKDAFGTQTAAIGEVSSREKSGKTVAFFYVTSSGGVNVRKASDYLPKMIALAGGSYIFSDLGDADDTASSTMTMQMEDFYAAAKDADYMVYNSAIEGELSSLEDFLAESPLLEKCKAVKEGHVYCTTRNLYQSSMELGTMIGDFYYMMAGEDEKLTYLYPLE